MKFSEMQYVRPDMDAFKKTTEELISKQLAAKSGEEQFEIHKEWYAIDGEFATAYNLAYIRHTIDTSDEYYTEENDFFDNNLPVYEECRTKYYETLFKSPFRPYLETILGPVAFNNMELSQKAFSEKNMALMQEENTLVSRYGKLIASAKIPYEGEVYNLSLMAPFTTNKDRAVRQKASKAVSDWFMANAEELDEIFDKLVKNRTAQAKNIGFDSFTDLAYCRMRRNSYNKADVENFRKQIKEYFVPFSKEIAAKTAERLGLEKLYSCDSSVYFKEGNPMPSGSPEEILAEGQKMYRELSPETAEFIDFMMDNELFDVLGRKTKLAGGYMTFIPKYKSPFVFANFNGTSGDVDVITHECGHAFQGYITRNEEITEKNDIGMETAEIHSMSMEYFTYGWMDKFFGDKAPDYYTMHLASSSSFLPYGTMVDEFQHIVYDNPEMTPAERRETWKKLEAQYRPSIDFSDNEFFATGGLWQRQRHIYESPFYYIDYVLASVGAMQFKVLMDENYENAWNTYLKFAKLSGSDYYTNMLKEAGLKAPFEDGCIKEIVEKMSAKLK